MLIRTLVGGVAAIGLAACTTTGNVERNAAGGAAVGALAGAVLGNNVGDGDAGTGAAVGAAVGAAAGAARGYGQDQKQDECARFRSEQTIYDTSADRYYYRIPGTDRTCWTNGQPRGW